ncbi:hypothetical protein [uncultured Neglectibacter sp.]
MGRTGPWYHPNCRKKPKGSFLTAFSRYRRDTPPLLAAAVPNRAM